MNDLCRDIRGELFIYSISRKPDLGVFKQNCLNHIEAVREPLEKHRGCKEILGNLALLIAGLVVFYVIAAVINKAVNNKFLFFNTDSGTKLNELAGEVTKLEMQA